MVHRIVLNQFVGVPEAPVACLAVDEIVGARVIACHMHRQVLGRVV